MSIGIRDLILACATGVLLVPSFPKFDFGAAAWVSLVPLLVALEGKSPRQAYLLSHLAGIIFHSGLFYWIWAVEGYNLLDYVALQVLYLPSYFSLWGLGLVWLRKRTGLATWVIGPSLWVTLEFIRSHAWFISFPWALLGQSQYLYPSLIQVTAITGVYGLSFLIVLVNTAVSETLLNARFRLSRSDPSVAHPRSPVIPLAVAGVLFTATFLYGHFVLQEETRGERIKVALVQGNMTKEQAQDISGSPVRAFMERQVRLTRDAAREGPALIIWPETSVPGDVRHRPELRKQIAQLAVEVNSHLFVGSAEDAKFTDRKLRGKFYNSMVLFTPEGNVGGEYRKIQLVPFGEYAPLHDYMTWPKALVADVGKLLPGDKYTLFDVGGVKFASAICWEAIFPNLFREFVNRGASFMAIATNEGVFGETSAPYQLLAMGALRAAENRVAIARSAKTGVTALIDPFGRIIERVRDANQKDLFVEGVIIGDISLAREKTFYTLYGDLFAFLQIGVCVMILLYCLLEQILNRRLIRAVGLLPGEIFGRARMR